MKILKILIPVVLMLAFAISYSQNNTIQDKPVQAKLMKMDGKYYVFLTDAESNPYSNKNSTATGKAIGKKPSKQKLSLTPVGENAYMINENPGDFKKLKLSFHLQDAGYNEYVDATFSNKSMDESSFVCPMHPGELSKTEGKCPKCGMGMVSKKVNMFHPVPVKPKGLS